MIKRKQKVLVKIFFLLPSKKPLRFDDILKSPKNNVGKINV